MIQRFYIMYDENGKKLQRLVNTGPEEIVPGFTEVTKEEYDEPISEKPLAYAEKRRREYPSIGDQLDAIWKGGTEMTAMARKIIAIKEKYPKE